MPINVTNAERVEFNLLLAKQCASVRSIADTNKQPNKQRILKKTVTKVLLVLEKQEASVTDLVVEEGKLKLTLNIRTGVQTCGGKLTEVSNLYNKFPMVLDFCSTLWTINVYFFLRTFMI